MTVFTDEVLLRDSVFSVAATSYVNQVRKVRFVPETQVQTYKTLDPNGTIVDADDAVWTVELEGVQGNSAGGFAKYCRDNHATIQTLIFQPKTGSAKPTVTASVLIVALPFGGEQGATMDFDATFSVQGQPTFSTSV